jgi:transketolase
MRSKFADICLKVIEDEKTVIMVGDISHYLLRETHEYAPDRFFNIGICEQSMVSIASGLAMKGMQPIIHTIAPFLVERAYEQIKVDIGYQNTEVTIVTVGGTYDYSSLGCTHHCYGDIALMRTIPNMEVYEPGNSYEFEKLFQDTWKNGKPKYFRLSNHIHTQNFEVEANRIEIIRHSKNKKWIFVCGHLLDDVIQKEDYGICYVSSFNKISNHNEILELIKDADTIYSVENHLKVGGMGDFIHESFGCNIKKIGLDTKFLSEYGTYEELKNDAGMSTKDILKKLG